MNYNDSIGAIGVGIILLAYFLNIFSFIKKDGNFYFILNIIGASIACFASYLIHYMPFIVLEATWAIISVLGLLQNIKNTAY